MNCWSIISASSTRHRSTGRERRRKPVPDRIYYVDEADKPIIARRVREVQKKFKKPVVVEVEPLRHFYPAEEYHQDYLEKIRTAIAYRPFESPPPSRPREPLPQAAAARSSAAHPRAIPCHAGKRTEAPFTNPYHDQFEAGIYVDAVTGNRCLITRQIPVWMRLAQFYQPIEEYVVTLHGDEAMA